MGDEDPREWFILEFSGDRIPEEWIVGDGPFTYQEALRLWYDTWGHLDEPCLVRRASTPYATIKAGDLVHVIPESGPRALRAVADVGQHMITLQEPPGEGPHFVHEHRDSDDCSENCGPLVPMLSVSTPPVCPACGTGDWDFVLNDEAVCRNGHHWTQPTEDDVPEEDHLGEQDIRALRRTAAELYDHYGDPDDILSSHQRELLTRTEALLRQEDGE